jgi:hypothetical protein
VLARFSAIAHRVRADNVVIAGGLSPFTRDKPQTMAPLRFMRDLLCMSNATRPGPTCGARAVFDVWSHHPYTSGNASHHAFAADDVSLGDLPEMRRLLDAAVRAGHVVTQRHVQFWVTEFSWDTNPPDPNGVPARLHARWVAEALYQMWLSGINLVTWLQLRDSPYPADDYQSGLYLRGPSGMASDRAKPALTAFRFPFVAYARSGRISYWGRTPTSRAATVVVEQRVGRAWHRVASTRAGAAGIFFGSVRSSAGGALRARAVAESSLAFSLVVPRDRAVTPFGTGPRK